MTSSTWASDVQWKFHDPTSRSTYTVDRSTGTGAGSYTINISSGPRTDWWTTAPGSQPESSAHRTTGPLVYQTRHISSCTSWRLSALVSQPGLERFQQTTLFIQRCSEEQSDMAAQLWLKAGVENEGGRQYVGVVATNPYSDWNVSPLPKRKEHVQTKVLIEIEKIGPDVHVYYTLQGDEERLLLREKKGLALPVQAEQMEHWRLGAMVCGPLSDATQGLVQEWNWEVLPDSHHH